MATHRRYTKREKATTVIAAEMSSVAAAAESAGIPENTVRYWMDLPEFVELRTKTREEGAAGWSVLMHLTQARLAMLIDVMEPRDLIILGGVAAEKSQLLSGGATGRTEHRDLTNGLDDHEKAQLRDLLDSIEAEEATEDVPSGAEV